MGFRLGIWIQYSNRGRLTSEGVGKGWVIFAGNFGGVEFVRAEIGTRLLASSAATVLPEDPLPKLAFTSPYMPTY